MRAGFIVCITAILLLSPFLQLTAIASTETNLTDYLELTGKGESMTPTIYPGDRVRVKLRLNETSTKVGFWNGSNPGDIIVYGTIAALAYIPKPSCMWICHRVIEKYERDGKWFFRTMGDNNPEPDPWEVPHYWVLGLVVEINHRNYSTSEPSDYSYKAPNQSILSSDVTDLQLIGELAIGIFLGLTFGFVITKVVEKKYTNRY